jgi:hypothetical protein
MTGRQKRDSFARPFKPLREPRSLTCRFFVILNPRPSCSLIGDTLFWFAKIHQPQGASLDIWREIYKSASASEDDNK